MFDERVVTGIFFLENIKLFVNIINAFPLKTIKDVYLRGSVFLFGS